MCLVWVYSLPCSSQSGVCDESSGSAAGDELRQITGVNLRSRCGLYLTLSSFIIPQRGQCRGSGNYPSRSQLKHIQFVLMKITAAQF